MIKIDCSFLNDLQRRNHSVETIVTASQMFGHARRLTSAYCLFTQPLCDRLGMPQPALDILLFLANNPGCDTAKDICQIRGLKPGIVSLHVKNLVSEGLLTREEIPGDRRKYRLAPTEKAGEAIRLGREAQRQFGRLLLEGLNDEDTASILACVKTIDRNLERIRQEKLQMDEKEDREC